MGASPRPCARFLERLAGSCTSALPWKSLPSVPHGNTVAHPFANATLARAQTHFFIFSASKISPHLARPVSGRFTNARCEAQMHPKGKPCRYVLNPHNPRGCEHFVPATLLCIVGIHHLQPLSPNSINALFLLSHNTP